MEKSSSRSSFKLETPLGPSQGMEAATAAEEPVAKAPENATSGVIQNIPGSVHETPPPVVNLPLPAAPHPAPTAQTEVPVYSPRSSFIPPDIEVAKRHASENRPMMRDASGQIIPYVEAWRAPLCSESALATLHSPSPGMQVPFRRAYF
jgi:hypothetical protein